MNIIGILWDYDQTLVNSAIKNMEVVLEVLKEFDPEVEQHLPKVLSSYENYQEANYRYKNWRELYKICYDMTEEQIDQAGRMWTSKQLENHTLPLMFDGLDVLLHQLKPIKMGICSQNGSESIRQMLKHYGVDDCFEAIIGTVDVSLREQKPHPAGFIKCIEQLGQKDTKGTFLYIGDHSEDIAFGKNAEKLLQEKHQNVVCISVDFMRLNTEAYKNWAIAPDYYVQTVKELETVIDKIKKR